jgi:hypothetical protein
MVLAVVGNKIDLFEDEEIGYAIVKEYAYKIGAILKIVSAKEGKNIEVASILFRTCSKWLERWPC